MTDSILRVRDYRHLLGAQLVALAGNGLATVALGLLAFQLAGSSAAAVLGTALAIKMIAYVVVAPIAGAYADRFHRRHLLVALDLIRAGMVLALPFVTQVWQVYVLVALMQAASAAFTPSFQATLPEVLPDEAQYTRALSLSQLAATMETLLSPLLAAVLITVVDFHWLFGATAAGFVASGVLVETSRIPNALHGNDYGVGERLFTGARIFAATPRLRGLMGLNLAVSAIGAIVMVNTVNLVQEHLRRPAADVAWLLTANGAGILVVAMAIPRLLRRYGERRVMITGAATMTAAGVVALIAVTVGTTPSWPVLCAIWAVIGMGSGAVLTPAGNVIRRSSAPADRPALFAAQFSLSHACWLLSYPIAGLLATWRGYPEAWTLLVALAVLGTATALRAWPARETDQVEHCHPLGAADPAHVRGATRTEHGYTHRHVLVIDRQHRHWPDDKGFLAV